MSGVATLKIRGSKRHFDEMAVDLPIPPQACSPNRFPMRPPPLKRGRSIAPSSTTSSSSSSSSSSAPLSPTKQPLVPKDRRQINSNSSKSPTRYRPTGQSPDKQQQKVVVSTEDLTALARHLPKKLKKQLIDRLASGQVTNNEKLFTLTDLREIVNSVIMEHDAKTKVQFTNTLNERLAEQFRDFTKFNEDYVARQLRGTDVAYLS